ncbi:hypothetical protein AKG09_07090 [Neisseria sp. 83E34]|nr:hypothetical protein AKG09_07090 [Neisseria sp. 83E34]
MLHKIALSLRKRANYNFLQFFMHGYFQTGISKEPGYIVNQYIFNTRQQAADSTDSTARSGNAVVKIKLIDYICYQLAN